MENLKNKSGFLTGYQLKLIAIILMVFDHLHQMFNMFGAPLWLTMLGRPVAPIFLFLSSEGFYYTRNKKKYIFRLWIAFALMSISSNLLQRTFPLDNIMLINSMFGTLFLTSYYMLMIDNLKNGIKDKKTSTIFLAILGILLPIILDSLFLLFIGSIPPVLINFTSIIPFPTMVEGSYTWIVLGVAFYLLKDKNKYIRILPLVILSLFSFIQGMGSPGNIQWLMIFAAIPILLYNGKQGRKSKYFFYIFYPAHIYILYLVSYFIQS